MHNLTDICGIQHTQPHYFLGEMRFCALLLTNFGKGTSLVQERDWGFESEIRRCHGEFDIFRRRITAVDTDFIRSDCCVSAFVKNLESVLVKTMEDGAMTKDISASIAELKHAKFAFTVKFIDTVARTL
jgi:hypothetical protein